MRVAGHSGVWACQADVLVVADKGGTRQVESNGQVRPQRLKGRPRRSCQVPGNSPARGGEAFFLLQLCTCILKDMQWLRSGWLQIETYFPERRLKEITDEVKRRCIISSTIDSSPHTKLTTELKAAPKVFKSSMGHWLDQH